jgi:hypothetical protein
LSHPANHREIAADHFIETNPTRDPPGQSAVTFDRQRRPQDLGRSSLPVLGPGRPGYDRRISDYVVKNLMQPEAAAAR